MSNEDRTITRRRAIGTGTLFLGAGILSAAGSRPAPLAAEPIAVPTVPAVRVVSYPDLTADVRACVEAYHAADAKERAAAETLEAHLGRDLYLKAMRFVEGPYNERQDAWEDLMLAEMERHLPGVAPVLHMVRQHILEAGRADWGTCCVPGTEA